jgi:hypothetical protein
MSALSPYARRCIRFQERLGTWALEERRNHYVRSVFARAVREHAKTMKIRGLAPRDWHAIVDRATSAAWASVVDPPDEDLEPEAEAFMAAMRREIHGF